MIELTPRLRRITAPNPGIMTGEGTNTYLVGHERIAVIDPGPAIDSHIDAIVEAVGNRLEWIIVTHTHPDHSPAASILAEKTGAPCLGLQAANAKFQDQTFTPDRTLSHDDLIQTDEFTLRTIHTPGHVDNHLCYLLEEDGIFIAGDHLMNGSTVVIIPPEGDMQDYIDSLQRMLDYSIQAIAPGHGELMKNPRELVEWTLQHRLAREAKVIEKLQPLGAVTTAELVASVYDDVDPQLHSFAEFSLLAHLIKLEKEGRAARQLKGDIEHWQVVPQS